MVGVPLVGSFAGAIGAYRAQWLGAVEALGAYRKR